jgi:small subunit ribosomal protein S20
MCFVIIVVLRSEQEGFSMANIKSQKKRALTNLKRQNARAGQKSELKTRIKKVLAAVEANDKDAAVTAFNEANKALDKAVVSHIKHKNYVARQKSRLAKAVNSIN